MCASLQISFFIRVFGLHMIKNIVIKQIQNFILMEIKEKNIVNFK